MKKQWTITEQIHYYQPQNLFDRMAYIFTTWIGNLFWHFLFVITISRICFPFHNILRPLYSHLYLFPFCSFLVPPILFTYLHKSFAESYLNYIYNKVHLLVTKNLSYFYLKLSKKYTLIWGMKLQCVQYYIQSVVHFTVSIIVKQCKWYKVIYLQPNSLT